MRKINWSVSLQIIGLIFTASGSIIAIESLWRKRLRDGIKFIQDANEKIGEFWAISFFMTLFATALGNISEKNKNKKHKKWRKSFLFIGIISFFLTRAIYSLELGEKLLRKIDVKLISIGIELIIVGVIVQIVGLLIS